MFRRVPLQNERTERDVLDTQDRIRDLVRRDYEQQTGRKFFIDNEVVHRCWATIWRWLSVSSLSSHLLRYGVVSDPSELYSLTNPYETPRRRADHLLSLVFNGGIYGYHILYMCIRDDDENPLGHASAVETLIETARQMGKRAPVQLLCNGGRLANHDGRPVERDGSVAGERGDSDHDSEDDDQPGGQSLPHAQHRREGSVTPPIQESEDNTGQLLLTTQPQAPSPPAAPGPTALLPAMRQASLHSPEEETRNWQQQQQQQSDDVEIDGPRRLSPNPSRRPILNQSSQRPGPSPSPQGRSSGASPQVTSSTGTVCHQRQVQPTHESLLGTVSDMISHGSLAGVDHLKVRRIDVQYLGMEDVETIEELVTEVIKFSLACLNSRCELVAGVIVAGVEEEEEEECMPRIAGLPFADNELFNLREKIAEGMKNKVWSKSDQSAAEPERGGSLVELIQLRHVPIPVSVGSGSQQRVVLAAIIPDWSVCQKKLYQLCEGRKKVVYQRLSGSNCPIKAPNMKHFHNGLCRAANEITSNGSSHGNPTL